jgi:phosphoribosyl 1,2-cyclic phosphate phosphodiesterase
MRLTFLGTGTSQGIPVIGCTCAVCRSTDQRDRRLRTSALLQVNDRSLLIDAGPDLRQQMLRNKVDRVDAVLLTHAHMDHMSGMDDLRSFNFLQKRPLDVYADGQTQQAVQRIYAYAFAQERYPGTPEFDLRTFGAEPFEAAGVPVIPIRVWHHHMVVWGFRIGRLAYITDANRIEEKEKEKLCNLDVLVVNALRREPHVSHFNLNQALGLVAELQPKRAYLTHMSHLLGLHDQVQKELPPGVALAQDGLVVHLK